MNQPLTGSFTSQMGDKQSVGDDGTCREDERRGGGQSRPALTNVSHVCRGEANVMRTRTAARGRTSKTQPVGGNGCICMITSKSGVRKKEPNMGVESCT